MRIELQMNLTPAGNGWSLAHGSHEVWVHRYGWRGFYDRLRFLLGLDEQRRKVKQCLTVAFFVKNADETPLLHAPNVFVHEMEIPPQLFTEDSK
jgi:hypothetical protein